MKSTLPLFAYFIMILNSNAQGNFCFTDRLYDNSSEAMLSMDAQEPPQLEEYIVNVVFHLLYVRDVDDLSNESLAAYLEGVNDIYAGKGDLRTVNPLYRELVHDSKIRFCLAETDPLGNPTTAINRKQIEAPFQQVTDDEPYKNEALGGISPWPVESYLNIWIVPFNNLPNISTNYGVPYKTFTPLINFIEFGIEGAVIDLQNFTGKLPLFEGEEIYGVAAHELGHVLGLLHTFGPFISIPLCEIDDFIDDTPLCMASTDCVDHLENTCTEPINDPPDNTSNIMNFACKTMMTRGQTDNMKANLDKMPSLLKASCDALVSVENTGIGDLIEVFPNPSNGLFNLKGLSRVEIAELHLFSSSGVEISMEASLPFGKLDIGHLDPGVYYLVIDFGDERSVRKLVKL